MSRRRSLLHDARRRAAAAQAVAGQGGWGGLPLTRMDDVAMKWRLRAPEGRSG